MMNKSYAFVSLLFPLACATAPVIETTMMVPPAHSEVARYREIAVMPFDGPGGEETADLIGKALSRAAFRGKNIFSVQDVRKLKDISEEYYGWMINPPLNTDTYSQIGRLLGVKAVYAGEVTAAAESVEDRSRSTVCEQYDYKINICVKEKKIAEHCSGWKGKFALNLRIIDVVAGRTVYSNTFSGTSEAVDCHDEVETESSSTKQFIADEIVNLLADILFHHVPEAAKMSELESARMRSTAYMLQAVAPYPVPVQMKLMNPGKDVSSRKARKKMTEGLEAVRQKLVKKACVLFAEAGALQPDAPSLLFDLGVCAEAEERFEEAQALYRRAGTLFGKNNAWVDAALTRVENRIIDKEILKRFE